MAEEISFSEEIKIEREWPSWQLEDDSAKIANSMMDELMNHFGAPKYPGFKENSEFHHLLSGDST